MGHEGDIGYDLQTQGDASTEDEVVLLVEEVVEEIVEEVVEEMVEEIVEEVVEEMVEEIVEEVVEEIDCSGTLALFVMPPCKINLNRKRSKSLHREFKSG